MVAADVQEAKKEAYLKRKGFAVVVAREEVPISDKNSGLSSARGPYGTSYIPV